MLWFIIFYLYAGLVGYLSASDEINKDFRYEPHKKAVLLLLYVSLWPLYPILHFIGDR
jgi:hypothetical protein